MEKIWSRSPNERPISIGFKGGLGVTQREAAVDPSFGRWTGHLKVCLLYVNSCYTNSKYPLPTCCLLAELTSYALPQLSIST